MEVELKDYLTIIGLFLTAIALIINANEYAKAQTWKKLEFLAKEVKSFFDDKYVRRALLLLDWNGIDLQLEPGEMYDGQNNVLINDTILQTALRHHSKVPGGKFLPKEVLVRKIFDEFLFQLGIFNQYLESGLMDINELRPYLEYYIHAMGQLENGRKDIETISQIWIYIDTYGYTEVQLLCEKFGYPITVES